MNTDWRELFCRLLDGEGLTDAEARDLADALRSHQARREAHRWLSLDAALRDQLAPEKAEHVAVSRERLLAKAALRERTTTVGRRAPEPRMARRRLVAALAAAAVLALVIGWAAIRGRYTAPSASGDFIIIRGALVFSPPVSIQREDLILVGPGGATISLGRYCGIDLSPDARLVVRGSPKKEVIELQAGRAAARVEPQKGEFRVSTALGTVDAVGTEFVTTVECPVKEGEPEMTRPSVIVSVVVIAGAVMCNFGDSALTLVGGESHVFAAEKAVLPEGMIGFRGELIGTIVSKAEKSFVLKVEKLGRVWKESKAKNPESVVGKEVAIDIVSEKSRLAEQHIKALAEMKKGDKIIVEAFCSEQNTLYVVEQLQKAGD